MGQLLSVVLWLVLGGLAASIGYGAFRRRSLAGGVGWLAGNLPGMASHRVGVAKRRGFAIHAYVGANGAGKSLICAADTIPTLAGIPWSCSNPDHFHTQAGVLSGLRMVLSTMRFCLPDGTDHPLWIPLDNFSLIIKAEHCDLILDEVGGAVGSSSGADDLPMAVKASLQELRRRDVFCRWTAPSWARASKVLRECSQAVTLVMGYAAVSHKDGIPFAGPHDFARMSEDGRSVVVDRCELDDAHTHSSGRQWGARRLMFARTFDATVFDEWTTAKRKKAKAVVRQVFWRPGSAAERAYDTHAYVEKLGQVTDGGTCLDCGGKRRPKACECESPTVRRRRLSTAPRLDQTSESV